MQNGRGQGGVASKIGKYQDPFTQSRRPALQILPHVRSRLYHYTRKSNHVYRRFGTGSRQLIKRIGVNGEIDLILKPYIPRNLECRPSIGPFADQCSALLASIPASTFPIQVFGPEGRPRVDQVLPNAWVSWRKLPASLLS